MQKLVAALDVGPKKTRVQRQRRATSGVPTGALRSVPGSGLRSVPGGGLRKPLEPLTVESLEHRLPLAADPIVTVNTNFGSFQIELFQSVAPQTVANFLSYVNSGAYSNSIFHRTVPGFV